MVERNLCLEEYIALIKSYPADGEHLTFTSASGSWEIWYCPEGKLYVPKNCEYTVSSDNQGGFIVTVKR